MKIQIDEKEIGEAVSCYLDKQGVDTGSYNLSFDVIAGRGDSGPRVEIALEKLEQQIPSEPIAREVPFGGETK